MEKCDEGSLYDYLHVESNILSWNLRFRMATGFFWIFQVEDIATGMEMLHDSDPPLIHRDLKSPNILVDIFKLKVSARVTRRRGGSRRENSGFRNCHASLHFCDSRTIDEISFGFTSDLACSGNHKWRRIYREKSLKFRWVSGDIYAYGLILWELVSREHPYKEFGNWYSQVLSTWNSSWSSKTPFWRENALKFRAGARPYGADS